MVSVARSGVDDKKKLNKWAENVKILDGIPHFWVKIFKFIKKYLSK